ncbi:MAG: acetyl-CoA carboxylase biotin carboxyl carrier protein [Pseudomonadota bacterium]
MDVKLVKALLRMFEASSIHELEVQSGDDKVRLVRSGASQAPAAFAPPPSLPVQAVPLAAPEPVSPGGNGHRPEPEGQMVKAPMVGTFYRAPSPAAPPFVDLGTLVQQGQVVCIIEAMKMMNEIEADCSGRVAEVYVENGQPVEYDHPLFRIAPA